METKVSIFAASASLIIVEGASARRAKAEPQQSASSTQLTGTVICSSLPHVRGLRSLDCTEATALIEQLQSVQRRLKAGKRVPFHLLSGAPTLDPMTKVSPHDAFLEMPFEKAFIIERVKTDNRLWQPYKISIKPGAHGLSGRSRSFEASTESLSAWKCSTGRRHHSNS